ncbi:hypothetical protein C8Q75DRAFT_735448 [Abortiporus biennis]|nr:hypothetical protein C8Q75DRAFT_735448 [Abortiporus biennis]
MQSRSIVLTLPNELLSMIKGNFPDYDLRTHIFFYNASPRFAALYGTEQDAESFFEKTYILCGLGLLPNEHPESTSFIQLATRIMLTDGCCDHPECGVARLERNMILMTRKKHMVGFKQPYWSNLRIYGRDLGTMSPEIDEYDGDDLKINPLFKYVKFGEDPLWVTRSSILEEDTYLRYPAPHESGQKSLIHEDHPIAARSFATFPPVRRVYTIFPMENPASPGGAENDHGVTVWDILNDVHQVLDIEMEVNSLVTLLDRVKYNEVFRPGCDLREMMDSFGTFRGFLNYFRWDGFQYEEYSENPAFIMRHAVAKRFLTVEEKAQAEAEL